jgi:hypothetical protein
MNDGEMRPTDVESPMWTTALHDVCGEPVGAAPAEVDGAPDVADELEELAAGAGAADAAGAAEAGVVEPADPVATAGAEVEPLAVAFDAAASGEALLQAASVSVAAMATTAAPTRVGEQARMRRERAEVATTGRM